MSEDHARIATADFIMSPIQTDRSGLIQTASQLLLPICYILSHFIQNQRLVMLGICSAHLKIRRLKLHTLYPIGRMSSFLHYCFPLLHTVDIRALKNSIRAVISKTELMYSHAKVCSFYPLNRLTNWMG